MIMKTKKHIKYSIGIITIIFLLSAITPIKVYADNGKIIVHVTRTGSKYHNGGCSYLKSDIITTLYDAVFVRGLSPCSSCNPPMYDNSYVQEENNYTITKSTPLTREDLEAIYNEPINPQISTNRSQKINWEPRSVVYVYHTIYHVHTCEYLNSDCERYLLINAIQQNCKPCKSCSPGTLTQKQIDEYLTSATNKEAEASEEDNNNYLWGNLIFFTSNFFNIVLCIFFIGFLLVGFISSFREHKKKKLENKRKQSFQQQSDDEKYSHYFSMYAFYHPLDFVQVPEGCFLKYGLPATKGKRKYGDYTVYITPHGECFHQNPQCSKHLETSNYIYAYNRRPCKRCVKDKIPEIQWYLDAAKIAKIKKEYNIP